MRAIMGGMDEISRGRRWLRLGILVVIVAALAAVAFSLRVPVGNDDARPLFENDSMKVWKAASPAVKRVTAEMVLDHLQRDGKLGPQTMASLRDADEQRAHVDELIVALDAAADRNRSTYVSPGQPISMTAETAAQKNGWNK
jgi:hypothetical protein